MDPGWILRLYGVGCLILHRSERGDVALLSIWGKMKGTLWVKG